MAIFTVLKAAGFYHKAKIASLVFFHHVWQDATMSAITAAQCRAARGLLGWNQDDLAGKARVALNTVRNFEASKTTPMSNNLEAIQRAFETAGVEFIPENGGGAGLRLRGRSATSG